MKKKVLQMLLLLSALLLLSGCITKQVVVVCKPPYIQVGTTCCLDINKNSICDYDDEELLVKSDAAEKSENISEQIETTTLEEEYQEPEATLPSAKPLSEALRSVVVIQVIKDGKVQSYGSGFISDPSGYILTNTHVIDSYDPTKITLTVETYSGTEYNASLVDWNWDYDLALLKIKEQLSFDLPYLDFGSIDDIWVGDEVYVLGSPMGLDFSITKGILSGKDRPGMRNETINSYIQIDAALNPGNSGGPILSKEGKVIGIATFGYLFLEGLNFGIESDTAKKIYDIMRTEKTTTPDSTTPKCRIDQRTYLPVLSNYGFRNFGTKVTGEKPDELNIFYRESDSTLHFKSIAMTFENSASISAKMCFRMRIISNGKVLFNSDVGNATLITPHSTLSDYPITIGFSDAYTPDWYYYEFTAYNCVNREKYYEFYRKDKYSIESRKGDMAVFEHC